MILMVVKIITLNQCKVISSKIYISISDAASDKKGECVDLLRVWKEDQTFSKSLGPIEEFRSDLMPILYA